MHKLVFLCRVLFCFGPPFYFGYAGGGTLAPLGWSAGMTLLAVGTGWRLRGRDILASTLLGMSFATVANMSIYFFGWWLASPELRSGQFTLGACLLGLLIFGTLTLVHRVGPASRVSLPAETAAGQPGPQIAPKKLHDLLSDEKAQLKRLAEPLYSKVRNGADCDEIPGATGAFGRDPRNPIPVNGPLGEIIYLSNLRMGPAQQKMMFHRLGSISAVDIYEVVSLDGARWDILFFHPCHPRKSRHSPSGYQIVAGAELDQYLLGTNEYLAGFPAHLADAIEQMSERLLGFQVRPPYVREALKQAIFERPADHVARLKIIIPMVRGEAVSLSAPVRV